LREKEQEGVKKREKIFFKVHQRERLRGFKAQESQASDLD
jgi:hypothetical protein